MNSKNFRELIRVADLLNSNLGITRDKVNVNITETTDEGFLYLKAENTNSAFDDKFSKELSQSGFSDIEVKNINENTTTFKILLVRN